MHVGGSAVALRAEGGRQLLLGEISRQVYAAARIEDRFADPRELCWALDYKLNPVLDLDPLPDGVSVGPEFVTFLWDSDRASRGLALFNALANRLVAETDADTFELVGYLAAPPSLVRFFGSLTLCLQPHVPQWWLRSWLRRWL